ncbi:conserved hypothetical protein [Tenacibaculum sp. 190524A02b]|uniref:Uncharacterized protein n=1 Tax=Tenacibaculum vairaonense TaxID=3137860 RepID=A0ABM9PIV3_9FLAO
MIAPVNINTKDSIVSLSMGIYDIYVVGGWYVNLGKFHLKLNKTTGNEVIRPKEVTLKIHSYFKKSRTKKIFSFEINKGGKYKIEFDGQESLILKKQGFIFGYLFGKQIDFKQIEILIERN